MRGFYVEDIRKQNRQNVSAMARIGFFDGKKYQVYIHTDDGGNIPHFHIMGTNTYGDMFHTCVEILQARYFHHSGEEGIFNSKDRKLLDAFLSGTNEEEEEKTNWQVLILEWNRNNSNKKIDYKKIKDLKPDYKNII